MISVGLVGTSWWSDLMYLSNLQDHPQGKITAICGRNRERAQEMADKWNIPHVYTDYKAMIESGNIQAVIVATSNDGHFPITMKALEAGLHVLCEKPMGLTYTEARQMAEMAAQKGVKHAVAFTWRFMPNARYVKELLDGGYIGKLHHCDLRYYTNFGHSGDYMWRIDAGKAGSGALADLGSHHINMAQWFFGDIVRVNAHVRAIVTRSPVDPDGKPFTPADDTATLQLEFESGASGVIHLSYVAADDTQLMDLQGSDGVLYSQFNFASNQQRVSGMKLGGEQVNEMPIPDHIWNGANRESSMETFTHVFSKQGLMTRDFITAIAENKAFKPDFDDGASVQRVIDAALKSHQERHWIDVDSIT